MAHHRQVAVDVIKNFVGGIVVASANPRFCVFDTRIAVIHRRLQKHTCLSVLKSWLPQNKGGIIVYNTLTEFMCRRTLDACWLLIGLVGV